MRYIFDEKNASLSIDIGENVVEAIKPTPLRHYDVNVVSDEGEISTGLIYGKNLQFAIAGGVFSVDNGFVVDVVMYGNIDPIRESPIGFRESCKVACFRVPDATPALTLLLMVAMDRQYRGDAIKAIANDVNDIIKLLHINLPVVAEDDSQTNEDRNRMGFRSNR